MPGCVAMVQQWIEDMGAFVKGLDPSHMVTVGAEGFWGPGAAREDANPGAWGAQTGQNFTINHLPAPVDFAAIHVWPDNWERCATALGAVLL